MEIVNNGNQNIRSDLDLEVGVNLSSENFHERARNVSIRNRMNQYFTGLGAWE